MKLCWSNVVSEIFKRIEDLGIVCASCPPDNSCVSELSLSPPVDIKILNECCACILEYILDSMQYVDRIYHSNELGDSITIYKLCDVVVETSGSTAIVVPITRLSNYIEVLEESGYSDIDAVKRWLNDSSKSHTE